MPVTVAMGGHRATPLPNTIRGGTSRHRSAILSLEPTDMLPDPAKRAAWTREATDSAIAEAVRGPEGEELLSWCAENAWRRDARLSPLLGVASAEARLSERVPAVARARVVQG